MHDYEMLADGDHVLVAVSGGVDSLVLCHILAKWRAKAPISFQLTAIHLDLAFAPELRPKVEVQLEQTGLSFQLISTTIGPDSLRMSDGQGSCFHCARLRRNQLFELARDLGCNKLAMGHHRQDIIETFFLNLCYGGNISTMLPKQSLFNGKLHIIRPMSYLRKEEIEELATLFKVRPVKNPCPLSETSKRAVLRQRLQLLFADEPTMESTIFASLSQVRPDYLPPVTRN